MQRKPLGEELDQIIKQIENPCPDRDTPEDMTAWSSLIGNPIVDEVPIGFSYFDNDFVSWDILCMATHVIRIRHTPQNKR